jgi:hypothetical protein
MNHMSLSLQSLFRWSNWVALLSLFLLAGCVSFPATIAAELEPPQNGQPNPYAPKKGAIEIAGKAIQAEASSKKTRKYAPPDLQRLPLKSGQVVVVDDTRGQGVFTGLFADTYIPWTHIGILSLEEDGPMVYETTATLIPLPGVRPNAWFSGKAMRTPLAEFWKGKIAGIYDLPTDVDPSKVVAYMRSHYERGTPFDPYFDLDDATAMYCSELVSFALTAGGAAPTKPRSMRENRSYTLLRTWLAMPSAQILMPGQLVSPEKLVARWSEDLSPTQIEAHFELRKELFRRFESDISMGSILKFNGSFFEMQESIDALINSVSIEIADFEGDLESVRRQVVRRAQEFFVNPAPTDKTKELADPR